MDQKATVVIGTLGSVLDSGTGAKRWDSWRPTVALCCHEDVLVRRLELIYQKQFSSIASVVVDDIRHVSPETEVRLHPLELSNAWDFEEVYGALHDFSLSYSWDVDREDYLVHVTTGTHVVQICLFLLTEAHYLPGRLLQTSPPGRKDPGSPGQMSIIDLDLSRYDRIAQRFHQRQRDAVSFLKSGIETRSAGFNALIERIEAVAIGSKAPILLTGPTGAGKSRLARRIYELKREQRQIEGQFVEVNCATLRGDAAMSALFGHVKGAFTGAMKDRPGLLRAADRGILFLDEIGDLGLDEQAMLLRALEEGTFFPFGGDREAHSDFQLIGGTNRELPALVRDGHFREDLIARINLWTFELPGISGRRADIEPNLDFELTQFERRHGVRVTFNREARDRFLSFAVSTEGVWKANFRDFNGAVTRMATLADRGRITRDVVEEEIVRLRAAWKDPEETPGRILERFLAPERLAALDRVERARLREVLEVCEGARSLSEAGRALFAASRARRKQTNDADRLRKYLDRLGIDWREVIRGGAGL